MKIKLIIILFFFFQNQKSTAAYFRDYKIVNFNLPILGKSSSGQEIRLGGFSGLQYVNSTKNGYQFLVVTDRGPNAEELNGNRPFLLPDFSPEIIKVEIDLKFESIKIKQRFKITNRELFPITGLPWPISGGETAVDVYGSVIKNTDGGIDVEGICQTDRNDLWIVEEYGPSICKLTQNAILKHCLTPGDGLPMQYAKRKPNKGFEAIVCKKNRLYAFMQSAIPGEENLGARVAVINLIDETFLGDYFYKFESKKSDKIGDATVLNDGTIAVIERDNKLGDQAFKKVFKINFDQKNKIINKKLWVDLVKSGFTYSEKAEGLTQLPTGELVILNDNDFGISGNPDKNGFVKYNNQAESVLIIKN